MFSSKLQFLMRKNVTDNCQHKKKCCKETWSLFPEIAQVEQQNYLWPAFWNIIFVTSKQSKWNDLEIWYCVTSKWNDAQIQWPIPQDWLSQASSEMSHITSALCKKINIHLIFSQYLVDFKILYEYSVKHCPPWKCFTSHQHSATKSF